MDNASSPPRVALSRPREDVRLTFPGGVVLSGPPGSTLDDFVRVWEHEAGLSSPPVTVALVDGRVEELSLEPCRDTAITPLDISTQEGMRAYRRALSLVLAVATSRLFPGAQVSIDHSITANGLFCTMRNRPPLSPDEVHALEQEMRGLVAADLPIRRKQLALSEAIAAFAAQGYQDKVRLLRFHRSPTVEVYELEGIIDGFYGPLATRTGPLQRFRLEPNEDGFILLLPLVEDPSRFPGELRFPKLTEQFRQAARWLSSVGAEDAGSLNAAIERGSLRELVLIAEALHERGIADIAVSVAKRRDVRIVFIAGPTSSGKTTFAKRLGVQLAASGVHSFAVGLDDYFLERDLTPRDESGEPDFEAFTAVDQALFNDHMLRLLRGETVSMPRYDFVTGKRGQGQDVSLPDGTVLLVEGLHGLNPRLLPGAPKDALYKVYVSCLSLLNIDHHNHIPTSDARLLRRIVRDARFRGYSAEATVLRWQSVRRGERRFVFPYQEEADVMFNSSLPYEIAVLKPLVEPLLLPFDHGSPASVEVRRLLSILALFLPADADTVPDNSLLREFVGGSILEQVQLAGAARP